MLKVKNFEELYNYLMNIKTSEEKNIFFRKVNQIFIGRELYEADLIGGDKEDCYICFSSPSDDMRYIRISYTLFKVGEHSYRGINEIKNVELFV